MIDPGKKVRIEYIRDRKTLDELAADQIIQGNLTLDKIPTSDREAVDSIVRNKTGFGSELQLTRSY